jgi:hypothetical protein
LIDQALWMRCGPDEHILQIRERRDVSQFAALDERVHQCGAASALKAAGEEPVLPADRDEAELIFDARMPPARLCRVDRSRHWIEGIPTRAIGADAA